MPPFAAAHMDADFPSSVSTSCLFVIIRLTLLLEVPSYCYLERTGICLLGMPGSRVTQHIPDAFLNVVDRHVRSFMLLRENRKAESDRVTPARDTDGLTRTRRLRTPP